MNINFNFKTDKKCIMFEKRLKAALLASSEIEVSQFIFLDSDALI